MRKRNGFLWGIGTLFVAVAIFGIAAYLTPAENSNAIGETIVTPPPTTGHVNEQIAVSGVSINGVGNDIVPVKLQVGQGTLYVSVTTGLTFSGPQAGSTIAFTGTRNDVNAALATLYYSFTGVGSATVTVSLSDQNTVFNPANNHVYQYIPGLIDWYTARDDASARSYQGVPGYLATVTSQEENDFIKDRLNGNAWLGASDDAQYYGEGAWSWVDGPEAGNIFFNTPFSSPTGSGNYYINNWASGEPNNANDNENCMETYISDGTWNDLPCDDAAVDGYVVEYGDGITHPTGFPSETFTINTTSFIYADGDGSVQNPYQITDCEQLQDMNEFLSSSYILTKDIDCTETANWNGGYGFLPVGNNVGPGGSPFTGVLDGNGYSIDGLTEIRADDDSNTTDQTDPSTNQDYVGLFGYGNNLTIKNLHMTNEKIKGYEYVGGLVGYMTNGSITNSTVNEGLDESVDTSCNPGYCIWARYGQYGGGLVGYMNGGTISDASVGGLVKGSGNVIGGLVGHTESATISDSGSTAAVDGGMYIGGVVGQLYNGSSLTRVFATGAVTAKINDEVGKAGRYAGGLVGEADNSTISTSYATGNVWADDAYSGGLVGSAMFVTINDIYATGNVHNADAFSGGVIGFGMGVDISRAYATGHIEGPSGTGGFAGELDSGSVNNSFVVGSATGDGRPAAFVALNASLFNQNYFDITAAGAPDCIMYYAVNQCFGVNQSHTQPDYFKTYTNAPFYTDDSQVWDVNSIWYFDGVHLPVLRMGQNEASSVLPVVYDTDGISTAVENAAPNNGDGNDDGIQDGTQANVVSYEDIATNKYVTIQVDASCSIIAASSIVAADRSDSAFSYPSGLLNYIVDCGVAGFSTPVVIYYHGVANTHNLVARKYNSVTQTYATIPSAVVSGSDPVTVSYMLTDGGSLDEDGTANGSIVDPIGLGVQNVMPVGAPNTGEKSQSPLLFIGAAIVGLILLGATFLIVRRHAYRTSN